MRDLATVPVTKSWPRSFQVDYAAFFSLFSLRELQGLQMRGGCDTKLSKAFFSFRGNVSGTTEACQLQPCPRDAPSEVSQSPRGTASLGGSRHSDSGLRGGRGLCSASGPQFLICKSGAVLFFS